MKTPSREYLESKIASCRAAIAYAHPAADTSYARALLFAAENQLAAMNAAERGEPDPRIAPSAPTAPHRA